jgi:hypothetical protein
MSRSLTLPVPSVRQVALTVGTVVLAIILLILGIRLGATLLAPSPVMELAAGGDLHQVQLLGGVVYLGTIAGDDRATLRLTRPALVRQEQAPAASGTTGGPRIVVQSLATDPYGIAADVLIPLDKVLLIGVVQPTSSLGQAYGEAMGLTPAPSAAPSP